MSEAVGPYQLGNGICVDDGVMVLGGGLSGLAASLSLGAPIYEASSSVGGVSRTKLVDGFSFDYGIHVLQTKHPTIVELFKNLGIGLCTRRRIAMIYSHQTYTAYPFQVNTAGLPVGLRARCVWQYVRRERGASPKDYREWIYQNVGKGFGDTFLIPYSEKFWTVHPREMTSEWTGNRVPSTSLWHVLRGSVVSKQTKVGTNAVFEYPEGDGAGYGVIPTKMGRPLTNTFLNHRATRIDTSARRVEFNGGEVNCSYKHLVSTIPLPELIKLIPEAPDDVVAAAGRLRTNSIYVVNLGIDNPSLSNRHWVHFPEKDLSFFRISYPHNLGPGMAPAGMSSISAEVAYSDWKPLDKSTIVERVKADLIKTGSMGANDRVVLEDVMDIKYAYAIYDEHRKAAVREIHDWLKTVGIHPTGRYGLWAYLWSHESILAGMQTAKRLCQEVVGAD